MSLFEAHIVIKKFSSRNDLFWSYKLLLNQNAFNSIEKRLFLIESFRYNFEGEFCPLNVEKEISTLHPREKMSIFVLGYDDKIIFFDIKWIDDDHRMNLPECENEIIFKSWFFNRSDLCLIQMLFYHFILFVNKLKLINVQTKL